MEKISFKLTFLIVLLITASGLLLSQSQNIFINFLLIYTSILYCLLLQIIKNKIILQVSRHSSYQELKPSQMHKFLVPTMENAWGNVHLSPDFVAILRKDWFVVPRAFVYAFEINIYMRWFIDVSSWYYEIKSFINYIKFLVLRKWI